MDEHERKLDGLGMSDAGHSKAGPAWMLKIGFCFEERNQEGEVASPASIEA
jgi:hypothetical protein